MTYEKENSYAIITLNRPEVLNAMNAQMWHELRDVLQQAKEEEDNKTIIFTGAGRAFSSGADLTESQYRSKEEYRDYLEELQKISKEIIFYPNPTIAAINGYALGSGLELALACDIRLASQQAKMGFPEAKIASSITGGTFLLLKEIIGLGKAKELLFTSRFITAEEAKKIGMINQVVTMEDLLQKAKELAKEISKNSLLSIRVMKEGLRLSQDKTLDEIMEYEVGSCLKTVTTEERKEKLKEFHKKK
ncbi:MAG: 3-hydroxypropionyl-coenzyme A dehydratase [Candidatus Heimdallarchaeota archaeon LC_3]|nr:MAG: 3-hydroxypropionyl-coenzyme A dehydratase [Candidatus Heimdallarchaeota archaeon LC_3]